MQFRILGPLEVVRAGRALELGRPQQRAVLAVLLTHPNQTVSLDQLIELLWGEVPPSRAGAVVQAHISDLRRALEPDRAARAPARVLLTQAPGYRLILGGDDLDAERFERLAAVGHRLMAEHSPVAARESLSEALSLWRGPPLAEFVRYGFAEAEAARLHELRQVALEDRLEADLALGEHAQAAAELEALVGERPLREHLWGLLMIALYRSGRQGEALRAYAQARQILGEELGIEPGPALRRLEADVLAQAPTLDWRPPAKQGQPPAPSLAPYAPAGPGARPTDGSANMVRGHHWFGAAPVAGPERCLAASLQMAEAAQARMAFGEAEDLLRRALDLVGRVAPGPERSRKEIEAQSRFGALLVLSRGWTVPEAGAAWTRVRELCREVGTPPELLPSFWGLFTLVLSRLETEAMAGVAGQLAALAHDGADDAFLLAADLSAGITAFHLGRLHEARRSLEAAMVTHAAVDGGTDLVDAFVGIDPATTLRGYLSLTLWLLGERARASQVSGEGMRMARAAGHPLNFAVALLFDALLAAQEGDTARVRARCEEISADERGSQDLELATMVLSAWASAGKEDGATVQLRRGLTLMLAADHRIYGTLFAGLLVDAHLRAGEPDAALAAADEALAQMEAGGERFYQAELCRLRAEAVLAGAPQRRDEAEHWLRRAVAAADSQHATSLRQRAEASLARVTEHVSSPS